MVCMTNTATDIDRNRPADTQQLTLLSMPTAAELKPSAVHARFQLSTTTRTRGLAHVAEIRAQLAATKAAREEQHVVRLPVRTDHAA